MAHVEFLRVGNIAQQRPGGTDGSVVPAQAALVHVVKAELGADARGGREKVEAPVPALQHGGELFRKKVPQGAFLLRPGGEQRLPGGEAAQFIEDMGNRVALEGGAAEFSRGDIAESGRAPAVVQIHGADIIAPLLLQHGALGDRARGDDADNVPLDKALGQRRILGLLADGYLIALGYEPGNIGLGAVIGNAAHGRSLVRVFHIAVPCGQGQVQLFGGQLRVLVEHLIKIAQAEKEQTILMFALYLVVLPFHRGKLSHFLSLHTAPRYSRNIFSRL